MLKTLGLVVVIGSIIGVAVWLGFGDSGQDAPPEYINGSISGYISEGEIVDLEQFLVKDQYTLFFFTSDTCAISQDTLAAVETILPALPFVAFRKIDITEPESPIMARYRVRYTPHCVLYDSQGQVLGASPEICFLFKHLLSEGLLQDKLKYMKPEKKFILKES